MTKDDWTGLLIIAGIIIIGLTGGLKGPQNNGLISNGTGTPVQKTPTQISYEIKSLERQVDDLKKKISEEEAKKYRSVYYGKVELAYVNRSRDASREYVTLRVKSATTTIPITGWTLKSASSGSTVSIPKGTYLYFTDSLNAEQDIYVSGSETIYIITGVSPVGVSFKVNKCSGYHNQFQTFIPYIQNSCPHPSDEDLSSIPNIVINDACLAYIERFPRCRVQTQPLPQEWSVECRNFIVNKINYPSCVNTHKSDSDFYKNEWRVYLKRGSPLWKERREHIILYDSVGKIVDEIEY